MVHVGHVQAQQYSPARAASLIPDQAGLGVGLPHMPVVAPHIHFLRPTGELPFAVTSPSSVSPVDTCGGDCSVAGGVF